MTPTRIAFVGRRMSGKTTAANYLAECKGFKRVSLADPVKDVAAVMVNAFVAYENPNEMNGEPWSDHYFTRDDIDNDKALFRPLLEWVGTTLGREYFNSPDHWIKSFARRLPSGESVVCDDMRHPNESEALKGMGFTVVKIVRPENMRLAALRAAGEPEGPMASEVHIDEIVPDATISNSGGLLDMIGEVDTVLDRLGRQGGRLYDFVR